MREGLAKEEGTLIVFFGVLGMRWRGWEGGSAGWLLVRVGDQDEQGWPEGRRERKKERKKGRKERRKERVKEHTKKNQARRND